MSRKLFGVIDPDGKTVHVFGFSAKVCKHEFVRPFLHHEETFERAWEEAKAEGYRCIEIGFCPSKRKKYEIADDAPDSWELLREVEDAYRS